MTGEEIQARAKQDGTPGYGGWSRDRGLGPGPGRALRFRTPDEGVTVVHDFSWSRDQIRPGFFTDKERAEYPPVRHPLVRRNPANGREVLFLGAHASHVEGLSVEEGRAFLKELLDHVTQPQFCYRHQWKQDDIILWDNRCTMHIALGDYADGEIRHLERTTVRGTPAGYYLQ